MSVKNSIDIHQGVVKCGYLRKVKTSKKKFFVLRAETPEASARLEYYDTERKFNAGQAPKRAITLKSCFNINRQPDTKHKHVIALYTKDDRFCIAFESDDELEVWLKILLSLQHGEEIGEGEAPKPTFEHVWQVTLAKRGLGASFSSDSSVYRLCLTDRVLSLIKKDSMQPQIQLPLSTIRSCGNLKTYFFLEIGRSSAIGAGELWMETEDTNIAQNVHQTVYHAMSSNSSSREELGPKIRLRSSSATESSNPARRQTGPTAPKSLPFSHGLPTNNATTRERCDSMPSRARTTSEGNHISFMNQPRYLFPHRPISIGSPIAPNSSSTACSTDSAGSSTSIDDEHWHDTDLLGSSGASTGRCAHSLTPDEPIVEENGEDVVDGMPYLCHSGSSCVTFIPMHTNSTRSDDGYVDMSPSNRSHQQFMSPTASLSSVTSGTPSTDIRFVEYMLDKVPSYLTTSEDEGSDRPARAYSFGSRPEAGKYRSSNSTDTARERACSFGAKTKKVHSRILPPYSFYPHNNTGAKSSSAPLLSNHRLQGSHSSLSSSGNNYHVEMDFSRPVLSNTSNLISNSEYLDMGQIKKSSGYVEMKPGIPQDVLLDKRKVAQRKLHESNNNRNEDYVDMTAGTSPQSDNCNKIKETSGGYMDMNLGRNKRENIKKNKVISSPLSKSPLFTGNVGNYMDMNCNTNKHKSSEAVYYSSSPVKSSISPNIFEGSPSSIEYIDVDYPASTCSSMDGYVEMTPGKGTSHQRQSSLDGADENSDYTNMSMGSASFSSRKEERKSSRKEKKRSQPIQIQTNAPSQSAQMAKNIGSNSSPSFYTWTGRKYSTGTPPKMILPISGSNYGLYSSLPRTRSRQNSRRDSKDSSTSSGTTPSSSSTLFPMSLNSPSSPIKLEMPTVTNKLPPSTTKYTPSDDYAIMDFGNANKSNKAEPESEYVNYNPAKPYKRTQSSDYVPISPISAAKMAKDCESESIFRPITETEENVSHKYGSCRSLENLRSVEYTEASRPGSTSSELGSSSTLIDSRPSSVVNDPARPLQSGDMQLCYASLELKRPSEENRSTSPRTLKAQCSDGGASSSSIGSGGNSQEEGQNFTYAKIDFVKSSDSFKPQQQSSSQHLGKNNSKTTH